MEQRGCAYGDDRQIRAACLVRAEENPPFEMCICEGDLCNGDREREDLKDGDGEPEGEESAGGRLAAGGTLMMAAAMSCIF